VKKKTIDEGRVREKVDAIYIDLVMENMTKEC